MIQRRDGNLLEQDDLTHIAHQANLFHTFGAGLALQIARRYPGAEEADQQTPYGDYDKLGTFSWWTDAAGKTPTIVNLYTQRGMGGKADQTDYEAMAKALVKLEWQLRANRGRIVLGLPHGLGCGLAGGSWARVSGIIHDVFDSSPIKVVVCALPVRVQ